MTFRLAPVLACLTAAACSACLDTEPVHLGDVPADSASDETSVPDGLADTSEPAPDSAMTCVQFAPGAIDFALISTGTASSKTANLLNCGTTPVEITNLALSPAAPAFSFTTGAFGTPLVLMPGEALAIDVTASGQSVTNGEPIVQATSLIAQGRDGEIARLPLSARFGDGQCPIANITIDEGDEVPPQTVLHLSGLLSTASGGATITGYEWGVVQPVGSVSTFIPSWNGPSTNFEVNIVGTYIFRLRVTDSLGVRSCNQAEYTVVIGSDDAIRVELQWTSPGFPNGSGDQAPDLDLHLLHPLAGAYFDLPFDCYWDNPNPEWGIFAPAENPRFERDDTNGGGPEYISLAVPEQGARYCVGVHDWDALGFGSSFATLRIYIYGVLRAEYREVELTDDDIWDVACISWPSGQVEEFIAADGTSLSITHNYRGD